MQVRHRYGEKRVSEKIQIFTKNVKNACTLKFYMIIYLWNRKGLR